MFKQIAALAAISLTTVGCGGTEEPINQVATPSEAARTNNANPTAPDIDVPATPKNEGADSPVGED